MTTLTFSNCVKEIVAFFVATALSCGPSQLFGCIKGIVDACLLAMVHIKKHTIHSHVEQIKEDWNGFKTSQKAQRIAQKLGIATPDLTQQKAEDYFATKNRKIDSKIQKLYRSLTADACALIPLIGAHISWRVATNYRGASFIPLFSRGTAQLLENSPSLASRLLFLGRQSKTTNTTNESHAHIGVSTSTKKRTIEIYHDLGGKQGTTAKKIAEKTKRATVVLFHPNNGGAERLAQSASFYREKGYNTLAFTLGGYPGSPGVTTSEKSMYQDIEAIKRYLHDIGVTQVGYHGYSLGSGGAMQAAVGETRVTNLTTLFVVLDQPYTSAAAVGENVADCVGKGILSAGCPTGLDVELPGNLWTKTDGLDNLKKAAQLKERNIPLICFEARKDFLMGRTKKDNGDYAENFAQDLLAARYDTPSDRANHLVSLSGKHGHNSLRYTRLWNTDLIPSCAQAQAIHARGQLAQIHFATEP